MNEELKSFSESDYYAAYKRIRNQFRKFNPLSIIIACFNYLYKPTKDELEELQKQPWLILLLIKWILLDEQFDVHNNKSIPVNKLNKILQSVHDLGGLTRLPSDFEHYTLFFRSIAYQQFFYQRQFSIRHLARQQILFGQLPDNNLIQSKFKELTGLQINRFLELSLITLVRFISDKNSSLPLNWFSNVSHEYSDDERNNFLKSISLPLLSIKKSLLSRDSGRRTAQEYFEQTPFLEFPLIQTNTDFLCTYPNVLYRCLEHFIYDKLRLWDAQIFMGKFGPMFERYVEKSIEYMGLPYISESELKVHFNEKGNLVDFIVFDNDSNIFIDAKAVEMAYQGKVTHLSEVVKDKTKNSAIKAIKQAHDVLKQLENIEISHPHLRRRSKNYLLVITFKELYLGNGQTFYESVAREKIDSIYQEYKAYTHIKLEDMYFITIDEFDIFSELVKTKKIGFAEGIEVAKNKDQHPQTKKFDFLLHLMSWGRSNDMPSYLSEQSDEMFEKIKQILS